MNKLITINKLAEQMGLTSRTLRHWESEELFESKRDFDSGWRSYDDKAIARIKITALLRKLNIPIKEIKIVLDNNTFEKLRDVINNRISVLSAQTIENLLKEKQLKQFLSFLQEQSGTLISERNLSETLTNLSVPKNLTYETEDFTMSILNEHSSKVKFITLPPMRVAYNIAISTSPEDEAITPVVDWLKSSNLLGTSRLFGGDVNPMPSKNGEPYGYGMCASIPDDIAVPEYLKEMMLPGGLYAILESTDDIGGSWKALINYLSLNDKYEVDKSRLCFEEHIRNDNPDGSGNEYFLNLLEPVKLKTK
ncbi:MerR family transcriptional regulator [Tissierella carlieri]|uniref:MerR family transcriptional regulator n=1 Tax=Tissierella carlieri TaxID=689904 RepID=UPI003866098A